MTTITTIPTDSTSVPSRGRRYLKAAAGIAAGATLGWFAASTIDDDPVAVERATAVADTANVGASPVVMSPDAMTRWAETDTANVAPSPVVMSPDAMTRWAETDTANVAPSPVVMSPDAMTRWAETDTANVVPGASRP